MPLNDMWGDARFSDDRRYRYRLTRDWSGGAGRLAVIGLNPSTADEKKNDNTIAMLCRVAKEQGAGGLTVVNLFAFRATDPGRLRKALDSGVDIVGPRNDAFIREQVAAGEVVKVLAAWGNGGRLHGRDRQVRELVERVRPLYCLGMTKSGAPRHPRGIPAATRPARLA